MKSRCRDLEKALRRGDPERIASFEQHAVECAACRGALEAWRRISDAAPSMRKAWSSPELWPRIRHPIQSTKHFVPEIVPMIYVFHSTFA